MIDNYVPNPNSPSTYAAFGLSNQSPSDAEKAEKIMNKMIETEVNKPGNLLNDPILNRARANDPSVNKVFVESPTVFGDLNKTLIEDGDKVYDVDHNDQAQYEHFIDGTINKELYEEYLERNIDNPNLKTIGVLTSDKFWLDDFGVLYRNNNYYKIIPTKSMSKIEVLNSLTRFFIYLTVLYLLFAREVTYIYIPVIGIIMVLILYFIQKNDVLDQKKEQICRQDKCNQISVCQRPTADNPFMNVTMADLMDNKQRPPGCISTDKTIKREIDINFNRNLFKDVDDVFNRGYSQRQFYTMPSTTIPNNQTDFANWLYKMPETCKENQSNCLRYEDVRFSRFNPDTDRMEMMDE